MGRIDLTVEAFKRKVYATDGILYIRTEPTSGASVPFVGYIKTTLGEAKVIYSNKSLYNVLVTGREISADAYKNGRITVKNDLEKMRRALLKK